MDGKTYLLGDSHYPERLRRLSDAPTALHTVGAPLDPLLRPPCVAVVGSRKVSPYGRQVTEQLAGQLAELGVTVISGLALGVDGIAHQAALEADGNTVAVLPAGLSRIYPATHRRLASQILKQGGALISEYDNSVKQPMPYFFIARNRLIAGLSNAVLITEAAENSGSLHTARFALEQGIEVLAVPGGINSSTSKGTNNLIKCGATPVTGLQDILHALGLEGQDIPNALKRTAGSPDENLLIGLIADGTIEGHQLLQISGLAVDVYNRAMTMLEINGKVRALGGDRWGLR